MTDIVDSPNDGAMNEIHWIMEMLHHVDVGIVVLDIEYKVQIFNSFMENHSGLLPRQVKDESIFDLFKEIPKQWFKRKAESVFLLKNKSFTLWENRPYLFKFESYRPITSRADYMYQNTTFMPLFSTSGEVSHLCLLVYDVTETAMNKIYLEKANHELLMKNQIDHLTLLLNRSAWEDSLNAYYRQWENCGQSSSLLIVDVDLLSDFNELYGYVAGDNLLINLAATMKAVSPQEGVCGRYAGSQLGMLLPNMALEHAATLAYTLSRRVAEEEVSVDNTFISYTVSIGVATIDKYVEKPQHWLRFAYKALSLAKKNGVNQVVINDNKPVSK
jgi:diguanylate cyclase (GGDEF)-like protein